MATASGSPWRRRARRPAGRRRPGRLHGHLDERVGDARQGQQAALDLVPDLLGHLRVARRYGEGDARDAAVELGGLTRPNETMSRLKPGYLTFLSCSMISSAVT